MLLKIDLFEIIILDLIKILFTILKCESPLSQDILNPKSVKKLIKKVLLKK